MLFLIYSFLGWIVESLYCFVVDKKFVNRGYLIGPSLPIYGFGCLFMITFLSKYKDDPIVFFCMTVIVCSILEYLTSYIMEKIFKTRWWDYSQMKYNLNGRICLNNMLMFGVLGLVLIYFVNPFVVSLIDKIDITLFKILTCFFFVLFVIDVFVSTKIIYNIKSTSLSVLKDQTEEISAKVKEVLLSKGIFTRRVAKAFPNFKIRNRNKS